MLDLEHGHDTGRGGDSEGVGQEGEWNGGQRKSEREREGGREGGTKGGWVGGRENIAQTFYTLIE